MLARKNLKVTEERLLLQKERDSCLQNKLYCLSCFRSGPWELSQGPLEDQVIAKTSASILGQVNRRAAAILAPLLKADIISTEIKSNQEADGRRCKVLYIYALLGEGGNSQVRGSIFKNASPILIKPPKQTHPSCYKLASMVTQGHRPGFGFIPQACEPSSLFGQLETPVCCICFK